jgi:hypothetical protein
MENLINLKWNMNLPKNVRIFIGILFENKKWKFSTEMKQSCDGNSKKGNSLIIFRDDIKHGVKFQRKLIYNWICKCLDFCNLIFFFGFKRELKRKLCIGNFGQFWGIFI